MCDGGCRALRMLAEAKGGGAAAQNMSAQTCRWRWGGRVPHCGCRSAMRSNCRPHCGCRSAMRSNCRWVTFYAGATTAPNGLAAIIPIVSICGFITRFANFFLSLTGFGTKKSGNGFDNRIRLWRWRWRHSRAGIHEVRERRWIDRGLCTLGIWARVRPARYECQHHRRMRARGRSPAAAVATFSAAVCTGMGQGLSKGGGGRWLFGGHCCCCLRRDHVSAAKAALKRPLAAAFDGALCGHGQGVFAGEG